MGLETAAAPGHPRPPGERRRAALAAAAAWLLITLVACADPSSGPAGAPTTETAPGAPDPEPTATPSGGIAYEVAIEGVEDDALRSLLDEASETRRLIDRPPSSLARLHARTEGDEARLVQALHSRGHFAATVSSAIDEGTTPVRVVFRVDPGPLYHLDAVVVDVEPRPADLEVPSPAELGVPVGAPAESRLILDAEAALLAALEAQGHALAELRDRTALIDPAHASMELTLRADPGPKVHFGAIAITGLDQVDEAAVRRRLPWRQGAPITSEALEEGRKALRETGLFSGVRFELGTTPDAEGRVPVTVRLTERPHRSIDFGLRYRTDEGPGGDVRWTHRNFFGRGERVEARLDVSGIGGFLQGRFRKPDVWRRDLAFFAEGRLAYDDTDAFEAATIAARAGLEQRFAERTYLSGGPSFEIQKVDENATDLDDTYGLLSLPVRFDWDRSDDRLHPTRDGRMVVENEPFVDVFGNDLQFNRTRFDYAHYFLLVRDAPEIVLAGRTAIGTLFGEPLLDVPATKRFYAGGGGSVRGYGYQLAGKLGQGDDPIGGRSLLELSGEVRLRVTETIGGVVFVDAGTTYDGSVPDFGEPLRVGVGPGLRYFSPIGPVRVDLGFPIDRRNEDDPFQLYVSLGQAF